MHRLCIKTSRKWAGSNGEEPALDTPKRGRELVLFSLLFFLLVNSYYFIFNEQVYNNRPSVTIILYVPRLADRVVNAVPLL